MLFYGLPFDASLTGPDPLSGVRMAVPTDVRLSPHEPGCIEWRAGGTVDDTQVVAVRGGFCEFDAPRFSEGRPARGCLSRFIKLTSASDEEIAAFARDWGVLGFCADHDLPGAHGSCWPALPKVGREWFCDPADKWRELARRLRAILRLAYAVLQGERRREEDWEAIWAGRGHQIEDPSKWTDGRVDAPAMLTAAVTPLITDAGIAPRVWWHPDKGRYEFGLDLGGPAVPPPEGRRAPFLWPRGSPYPVLIAQLAAAITSGGLVPCAQCGEPFDYRDAGYERSPRVDRGAYCGDWCRGEARRSQKAAWKRGRPKGRKGDSNG